jgi:transcriptional regulator with XRE-family HTH domain
MAARMAGSRKTPERVVQLLQEEVSKTSQAATARATGLTLRGVQNYLKGIGEPTTASLEKIADYFGVSVPYLRGEIDLDYDEITKITPGLGIPNGVFHKITGEILSIFAGRGYGLPERGNPEREMYLTKITPIIQGEGEYWKAHHIKWELLADRELDEVISNLKAIKKMRDKLSAAHETPDKPTADRPPEN